MLGETPSVVQRLPVPSALSIMTRVVGRGAAGRVEDADLEVDQPHVGQLRIDRHQGLSQRSIERIHRTVALAHFHHALAGDVELHRGFGQGDQLALGVEPALGQHAEALQSEVIRHRMQLVPRQQLERGVGAVIGIALGLAVLDDLQQAGDAADAWDRPRARSGGSAP